MPSSHSEIHAGLQTHSMGGAYPWSIRGVGDRWQAVNLLDSNERGPIRNEYGEAFLDLPEPYRSREARCEKQAREARERSEAIRNIDAAAVESHGQTLYQYLEEIATNGY